MLLLIIKYVFVVYYVIVLVEVFFNLVKYDGVCYGVRDVEGVSDVLVGGVFYVLIRGKGFGEEVKRWILLGLYIFSLEVMDNYFIKV